LFNMDDIPLKWICEGPLGEAATLAAKVRGRPNSRPAVFANRLTQFSGRSTVNAQFDATFIRVAANVYAGLLHYPDNTPNLFDLASRLARATTELLDPNRQTTDSQAAAIRILAIALADSFDDKSGGLRDLLRALAATVTLLQKRANGTAPVGEAIVLALA
jgi:hypothetical protein